jgi:hypothetical protein
MGNFNRWALCAVLFVICFLFIRFLDGIDGKKMFEKVVGKTSDGFNGGNRRYYE